MSEPITRDEMNQMLAALQSQLTSSLRNEIAASEARMMAHIDARIEESELRMTVQMRQIETNMLGAFHGWARPYEIKARQLKESVAGFDERLDLLETRISELERRLAS